MRTRFCATMRRPAASIMALIAPARLRRIASGLMIEKVRSTAIAPFLWVKDRVAAYIEAPAMQQDRLPSAVCRDLPQSFGRLSLPERGTHVRGHGGAIRIAPHGTVRGLKWFFRETEFHTVRARLRASRSRSRLQLARRRPGKRQKRISERSFV